MQETEETQVQSLGQEDPLEESMTTHFLFFPGGSPGQRSLAGYSPCGLKESDTTEVTYHMHARDILCLLIWQETASVLAQSVKSPPAMQETQV